jgi:hypothetical protein
MTTAATALNGNGRLADTTTSVAAVAIDRFRLAGFYPDRVFVRWT